MAVMRFDQTLIPNFNCQNKIKILLLLKSKVWYSGTHTKQYKPIVEKGAGVKINMYVSKREKKGLKNYVLKDLGCDYYVDSIWNKYPSR